jgi:two-component system, cell cycle response regulator DivK
MYPYPLIYNWGKYTILIVEDDYSSVFYLKEILKDTQVNLEIVGDGEHAIQLCKENKTISLVLMDIQLPFMDGCEATREIKRIRPSLPVIAQTAYAMPYDMENCMAAGCDDYIAKPIDMLDLLNKINRFLVPDKA